VNIDIEIAGTPIPQGSKTPWGSEANKHTKPWRETVARAAAERMNGRGLFDGPVDVEITFIFARPKHHYGTGRNQGVLKPNAPKYMSGMPDLDKLCRAIGDALQGSMVRNDSQVVRLSAVKIYGERGCCYLRIRELV